MQLEHGPSTLHALQNICVHPSHFADLSLKTFTRTTARQVAVVYGC